MRQQKIRSVKPEVFIHETLWELEEKTGLPIRLAWIGLFTIADREGRFEWRPAQIKLCILPWDTIDFAAVLDALASVSLICKYTGSDGKLYGYFPSWKKHQVINPKEAQSRLPEPPPELPVNSPELPGSRQEVPPEQQSNSLLEVEVEVEVEGEPIPSELAKNPFSGGVKAARRLRAPAQSEENPGVTDQLITDSAQPNPTWETFAAYSEAFERRWGTPATKNDRQLGMCKTLVKLLGADAPSVAAFYLGHSDRRYVQDKHPLNLLVRDAEKIHNDWRTKKIITGTEASRGEAEDATTRAARNYYNQKHGIGGGNG